MISAFNDSLTVFPNREALSLFLRTHALAVLAAATLLLLGSCDDSQTSAPLKPPVKLETVEVGYHYAVIALEVEDFHEGDTYVVGRNGAPWFQGRLRAHRTSLTDTLLLPSRRYKYTATITHADGSLHHAPVMYVASRDSSTHDWIYTVERWGASGCHLHDLLVIDPDTNIWVAGDLRVAGPDGRAIGDYTVGHWDGKTWKFMTQPDGGALGKKFIVQLADGRMFTNRNFSIFDGKTWSSPEFQGPTMGHDYAVRTSEGTHIAGGGPRTWNLWDGSQGGTIKHLAPPEPWQVVDMYTEGDHVIATMIESSFSPQWRVYDQYKGVFTRLLRAGFLEHEFIISAWMARDAVVSAYCGTGGMILEGPVSPIHTDAYNADRYVVWMVRGSSSNNIWFGSSGNRIIHYNGSSFRFFTIPNLEPDNTGFIEIWVTDDRFVIAGPGGVILRGRRNH
jgi:hypothetical protein